MTKKIILVLVEGQTDQDTLAVVFTRLVQNKDVEFEVIRTELTAQDKMTAKYIEAAIREEIDKYFRKNPYLIQEDILKVIQLIDTDGAFIPHSMVQQSKDMHNANQELSPEQKEDLALEAALRYHENPEAFLQFINDETFSVQGDYQKTWEFIMENGNSLKRYTNLAVFFYRLGIGIK